MEVELIRLRKKKGDQKFPKKKKVGSLGIKYIDWNELELKIEDSRWKKS